MTPQTSKQPDPIEQILLKVLDRHKLYLENGAFAVGYADGDILDEALAAIRQEIERVCLSAIGDDENIDAMTRQGYSISETDIRNQLRAEQRACLAQALEAYKEDV